jgi:hypothetical protein
MKKLSIQQMENVQGGYVASLWCSGLMGAWSTGLGIAASMALATGPAAGVAIAGAALAFGVCAMVAVAEAKK